MGRIFVIVGAVLAVWSLGISQAGRQMTDQKSNAEQELTAMEHELAEAAIHGDIVKLERYTADDFLGFDPSGQELNKAQVLARFKSPDYELESLRHEDVRVRVFGDCAVATARTVVKGRYQGKEAGGQFRYLRVWIRRQGRWQAVAAQSTTIPQPSPRP